MLTREYIEDTLIMIGMPISLNGFTYIADAVEMLDTKEYENAKVTYLYDAIAKRHNDCPCNIERGIRGAFDSVRRNTSKQNIFESYIGTDHCNNQNSLKMLHRRLRINFEKDSIERKVSMGNLFDRDEMKELIDEAVDNDIMVATIQGDNSQSSRCSFIGVGNYNLGREYGRQLLTLIDYHKNSIAGNGTLSESQAYAQGVKYDVTIILDKNTKDSVQNVLSTAVQETVARQSQVDLSIDFVLVDESNAFAEEESIRDLFMKDNQPNVIICLSEQSTVCAYQTVVDHNKVGEVDILGYYVSDEIVNAIERGVIFSTISVDTTQVGESAVDVLMEYAQYGYTNQYVSADIVLVNKENADQYKQKEESYEE